MDTLQHFLAYALTAGFFAIIVRLSGGVVSLWDHLDLSSTIEKFKSGLRDISDGPIAWLHAAGYLVMCLLFATAAYHFDIDSTMTYTESIRAEMATTVGKLLSYGVFLLVGITFASTLLELFGARFARQNALFVQMAVIGSIVFDLMTDLPRIRGFTEQYYSTFVNSNNSWFGNIVFEAGYYLVFGIGWIFASYGFELLTIAFFYAFVGCLAKAIVGSKGRKPSGRTSGQRVDGQI